MRLQSQRAGDIGNSDKNVAAPAPATRSALVLEPPPGIDSIHALRFILKRLLRRCGMRCVALREICDTAAAGPAPQPCAQTPAIAFSAAAGSHHALSRAALSWRLDWDIRLALERRIGEAAS